MNGWALLKRCWRAAQAVSIRLKVMALGLGLVLLLGVAVTLYVRHMIEVIMREQLSMRGVAIATDLGARSADLLLTDNIFALHTLIRETAESHTDLRYTFVLDSRGQVVAHSFAKGFPAGLREVNAPHGDGKARVQLLQTEEGWIWDVAAPVFGGKAGTARIGLSETRLDIAEAAMTEHLLVATAVVSAFGMIISYLLSSIITRSLSDLVRTTHAVARGNLGGRVQVWANDEIGQLSRAFNQMVADLGTAKEESDRYNQQLVRRNRELAALHAVAAAVGAPYDHPETLARILASALEATGFDIGWVTLFDAGHGRLTCWVGFEPSGDAEEASRASSCSCQVGKGGRELLVAPMGCDCPAAGAVLADGRSAAYHTTVPLVVKGRVLGVLSVAGASADGFPAEDLELLIAVAQELAVVVENVQLWEELKNKEELRGRLLEAVITAQEEERKRVARELHDEAGQALTSLMVGLKVAAESPTADEMSQRLAQLRAIAAQTLGDLRALARQLRPGLLDDLGLDVAVQRYLEAYSSKFGLACDVEVVGFAQSERLPSHIELTLFRVIQEALTNIAKHAQARNVSVVLERRNGSVVVVVEDDGAGFDVQRMLEAPPEESRLGLHGMRERVLLAGGRLAIEAAPGRGTTVQATIPLAAELLGREESTVDTRESASG